jgi:BolA family transcriptional regulator, general stress-responsive regulator
LTLPRAAQLLSPMSLADTIREKLTAAFSPRDLAVIDDSAHHAGHSGSTREDGSRGETHFTVKIVSNKFAGLSRMERQRLIYDILSEEMAGRIHALSLTALSPADETRR